jgi:protein-arginine kinase activator protein McsA
MNGRPKRMLLESEVLAAQSISKTEAESARKLGVSFMTYRKYAKMYGLYGRVANMAGKGVSKAIKNEDSGKYPLNKVLENKFPNYSTTRLKARMIRSNRIEQKCNKCNFGEKRISDNVVPLLLNYIDGNVKNKLRDNLELLCYNCYFLYVNNPFGCRKSFKISDDGTPNQPIEDIQIDVKPEGTP